MTARASISVSGGCASISADIADIAECGRLIRSLAIRTGAEALERQTELARLPLLTSAALDPGGALRCELSIGAALDGPHGVTALAARCAVIAAAAELAAVAYTEADHLDTDVEPLISAVTHLPGALAHSAALAAHGQLSAAGQAVISTDPSIGDVVADAADARFVLGTARAWSATGALRGAYRLSAPGGDHAATVRNTGPATSAAVPGSLTALTAELAAGDTASGGSDPTQDSITVDVLDHPGAARQVIVELPGTRRWRPPGSVDAGVEDACSDLDAIDGGDSAYEDGVLQALRRAGVRRGDQVSLIGHSLGGIVAVNTALTEARTGEFDIARVVTLGSPVGRLARRLPSSTTLLAFENDRDVVPHLDGTANPSAPNVITVHGSVDAGGVAADHEVATGYLPLVEQAQASRDTSLRAEVADLGDALNASSATIQTFELGRR